MFPSSVIEHRIGVIPTASVPLTAANRGGFGVLGVHGPPPPPNAISLVPRTVDRHGYEATTISWQEAVR